MQLWYEHEDKFERKGCSSKLLRLAMTEVNRYIIQQG